MVKNVARADNNGERLANSSHLSEPLGVLTCVSGQRDDPAQRIGASKSDSCRRGGASPFLLVQQVPVAIHQAQPVSPRPRRPSHPSPRQRSQASSVVAISTSLARFI